MPAWDIRSPAPAASFLLLCNGFYYAFSSNRGAVQVWRSRERIIAGTTLLSADWPADAGRGGGALPLLDYDTVLFTGLDRDMEEDSGR